MKKINVGIIGVGNCASGLIQGVEYYKKHNESIIGLAHEVIGGYTPQAIEFTAAFDISRHKVGKTIRQAVFGKPNMVKWFEDWENNSTVQMSVKLDGVGEYVEEEIEPIRTTTTNKECERAILAHLKKTDTHILINYLPVGADIATKFWAGIALQAKCAFINCIPSFIASDPLWEKKFTKAKLPVFGDDIKGQVGATIVNRVLAKLCTDRGVKIDKMYQLNVGGNTDFKNMLERSRLQSKKISKTESVQSQLNIPLPEAQIHIGPSDYVEFLSNTKVAYIRIEGRLFMNQPFSIETRLEVDDKANSAGIVIDCIRYAQEALDNKKYGYQPISAYYMKHPLEQMKGS